MLATDATPQLTWDLARDVHQLFEFHFMVNAFRAGTVVAVVAAAIGWFVVLRQQTFAGHTLSVVGFPGAAGAIWLGVSATYGYFAFCIAAALVIALVPRGRGRAFSEESAVIGTIQAFALACGFLFASLYSGFLNGIDSLLFGSFLGITDGQVLTLLVVGAGALAVLIVIGRPLLFASVDADVASARGIPVRVLSVVFLVVLGVAVAEASQITGSLLVFALLVVPAAAAQRITSRPVVGFVGAIGLGLVITWLGLGLSYYADYPVGFWTTTVAFAIFLGAEIASRATRAALAARRPSPTVVGP
ncbi:MAG: ABC-type transporter, integral rane subunit [Actinomycetia bacterium]|nr:ABC-type transporter, integral rane subunit [Actinomycetes bacterium]